VEPIRAKPPTASIIEVIRISLNHNSM